ncbi:ROK family protein [Brevibacillus sp. SYP-B805]|uniref:ROK family protein n=1 Tax=Brevibacillus sp. SYP-B805 TaxID=1578199 RepID=UPI0013EA022D|nr:ROK family protein [Brevibacillus sp. SYP-B805]NGQ95766.1 ROK family protein [Brevibacillus sp. SYP-B805]
MEVFIGIDLGGTYIKAIALQKDGSLLLEKQIPTLPERGSGDVIKRMASFVKEIQETLNQPIKGVGVTVPGVLRREEGIVVMMPNFPPDQWRGVHLRDQLHQLTGWSVELLNDARAAAYGEKVFGAGRNFSHFICLTIGTGIGGGIVADGRLLMGSRGVGGEIGHQVVVPNGELCGCGNKGCLETVASGPAIVTSAIRFIKQGLHTKIRELVESDLNLITPEIVAQAAGMGDQAAIHILENVAGHICTALNNMKAVLNPEAVILGGGIANNDLLLRMIEERLEEKEILFPHYLGSMQVKRAELTHMAGAYGAAAWVMHTSREGK